MAKRATIFVLDREQEPSPEFLLVEAWLARWGDAIRIADYSSGGWEHLWNVEAPDEAVAELPREYLCSSDWAGILRNGN